MTGIEVETGHLAKCASKKKTSQVCELSTAETKLNILPREPTSHVLRMKKTTVLFDLGGTLVHYYERSEFPAILAQGIAEVQSLLEKRGLLAVTPGTVRARVSEEDHESPDNRSRPLEDRLIRIFDIDTSTRSEELVSEMCGHFVRPIFARSQCYQDTFPVLRELRARGFRTAIVSNTSWGSPAFLWRDEIKRIGLAEYMDALVFDRDIGWRKPARPIFEFALERLQARPDECVFVGDEPRWDIEGSRALGIEAILVDRVGNAPIGQERTVKDLSDLLPILRRQ